MFTPITLSGPPRAIGQDPELPECIILQMPLSARPTERWIELFDDPPTINLSLSQPHVDGQTIQRSITSEQQASQALGDTRMRIQEANRRYARELSEAEDRREAQSARIQVEREVFERLNERLKEMWDAGDRAG